MLAIYKREVKSYFHSVIGLLFIGATLFFVGLYFTVYNLLNNYPYFAYAVSGCVFLFLVSVPILTMRIMAEERRNKTDQLILTAPVKVSEIIIGKFLAALTMFVIPVVIVCIYPLILSAFGTVPLGEAYVSILGYFLFGMTAIAIGLFISSITENVVVAAILSFVFLFLGYMMTGITGLISETGNLLTKILSVYDLYTPFSNMMSGKLDLTSVVYFISLTALFLFLSMQAVQKRRYSVSVKNLSFTAYSSLGIVVAIAITVFLNICIKEMPSTWTEFDFTYNQMYTLSDQTKEYLDTIDSDVDIYVLVKESDGDQTLSATLSRYEAASKHVSVTYVDPNVNPKFYSNYTSTAPTSNSLIIVSDKRNRVVDYDDIYEYTYSMDYTTYSYSKSYTGYDGEGQITAAIDYVLTDDVPVVYMLTGHGESELEDTFTDALTKANVEYESFSLMTTDTIPDDAACVFINGATNDISADELEIFENYIDNGGKIVAVLGLTEERLENMAALLSYMGMTLHDGVLAETNSSYYYRSPYYSLPKISSSTYTTGLTKNYYIFMPYCVGVSVPEEDSDTISYDVFLKTSSDAYVTTDYSSMSFGAEEGDVTGQFALGAEAKKETGTDEDGNTVYGTLVVYSSAYTFTDAALQMVGDTNLTLFTNTITNFAEKELNVSIPVKSYDLEYLTIDSKSIIVLGSLVTVILPLISIIAGIVIFVVRRRK